MSVSVTTDIFCDRCGNWIHGLVSGKKLAVRARRIAKAAGWVRRRKEGKVSDLCPECLKEEANGTTDTTKSSD